MSILCCLAARKKKKIKEENANKILQVKLHHLGNVIDKDDPESNPKSTFSIDAPFSIPKSSTCNVKVVSHESPSKYQQQQEVLLAYEGEEDTHEENDTNYKSNLQISNDKLSVKDQDDDQNIYSDVENNNDGHLSDPGASNKPFLPSPKLKRSCSNLETKRVMLKAKIAANESFEDLQRLGEYGCMSPVSVTSNCSADKVILRKCSSSQILPSKSRRLWWKLFLWSHRNLHEPIKGVQNKILIINQQGGYSSDTLEPNRRTEKSKPKSKSKLEKVNKGDQKWKSVNQDYGLWPEKQWMAFPAGSSSRRVDEWIQEIPTEPILTICNEEDDEITFPPSPENSKRPAGSITDLPEEIAYANRVIQTLNSSSTVAYISGIGLKVIPMISGFSSLRSVNLSGNLIVNITPGSLPKGLHVLNLSKNKISVIEGLKELTRLRILDLSYNRISRIGQGLSKCTLIKELYLAGNKISNVEGLHRLLKLKILDLSFNKITTPKAIGQLVANYNSLQALNLLGNPIQNNLNDDQIRKTLCGLLPNLAYLNKQPANPQKAREMAKETVTKAALGNGNLSSRRRPVKRVGSGGSASVSRHRGGSGRHEVKARTHHRSTKGL
ncbi:hypothetical protein QVD17_01239 [Tagetes erecta]|uniref:Uncharacterized protein n=1 Tax=Tagetes erecta TaxID=13708 RepID=A0AAD8LD47_TARER|nr:hypothetical protein QVD17_01239 [Tagetes erecta]